MKQGAMVRVERIWEFGRSQVIRSSKCGLTEFCAFRSRRWIWSTHRASWIVLALLCFPARQLFSQADSAIILNIPHDSLRRCALAREETSGASQRLLTRTLDIAASPFSDKRTIMAKFDTTGRPLAFVDVAIRAKGPVIESAAVRFDTRGRAVAGVRQHITTSDFPKDSSGRLKRPNDNVPLLPLSRADLAHAETVSAWMWKHECSVKKRVSHGAPTVISLDSRRALSGRHSPASGHSSRPCARAAMAIVGQLRPPCTEERPCIRTSATGEDDRAGMAIHLISQPCADDLRWPSVRYAT